MSAVLFRYVPLRNFCFREKLWEQTKRQQENDKNQQQKQVKKKQWQFISGPFLQMLQLKETLWVDLAAE